MARPRRKQMEVHTAARCVALTGTASFLGGSLLAALAEDAAVDRIVAIDLKRPAGASSKKVRFYEVDLTQAAAEARLAEILAAEGASTLVHLAFQASPSHATAYAHELESVGTMHVLVAARQARVRKIVLRSSTLLYGARPSNPNYLGEHQPLRAPRSEPFFADKVEAEAELARFVERSDGACATVLRLAPLLGPTVENFLTRWLSRRFVVTSMGFDPLIQVLHEADAVAAFKLAVDRDLAGTFNVCADGVLPVSTVIELAGRVALPIPHPIAEPLVALAWLAQLSPAPPTFLPYLRFVCVADGARARDVMGFRPAFTTREAVLDFARAQQSRGGRLLEDASPKELAG